MSKLSKVPAYRIKITLLDVEPPVWRRVVLPGGWSLSTVHVAVQLAMGWEDNHLHEFKAGGVRWGEPSDWDAGDVRRETTGRLHEVLTAVGDELQYHYDFGDDWRHVLVVEDVLAPQTTATCIDGSGACPPEDCGGPWGYEELLHVLGAPQHPEHQERVEWVGGAFDPNVFDVAGVNHALGRLR